MHFCQPKAAFSWNADALYACGKYEVHEHFMLDNLSKTLYNNLQIAHHFFPKGNEGTKTLFSSSESRWRVKTGGRKAGYLTPELPA